MPRIQLRKGAVGFTYEEGHDKLPYGKLTGMPKPMFGWGSKSPFHIPNSSCFIGAGSPPETTASERRANVETHVS